MTDPVQLLKNDAMRVTAWLDSYFTKIGDKPAAKLLSAMRYSALNGGKRMRASLVLSAARMAGQTCDETAYLAVAGAVEMIHAYSLIHDDLPAMDDADLRRGVAACHIKFDEATAILAGDALQTEAFTVLSSAGLAVDAECQLKLISILAQASGHAGMAGGQMLDLLAETTSPNLEQTQHMQELKTGALICASAMMGTLIGGGDLKMQRAVNRYASQLGFAFQIADDLLDYQADARQLGKPAGRDAEQGKASFVDLLGETQAREKANALVEGACESLSEYGERADALCSLARFAIDRNH